jgi:hypothetical protein
VNVVLGDDAPTAVANYGKTALVSQGIATDSKIVRRDEDELYPASPEEVRATAQHIELCALYVAVKNVELLNRLGFNKDRYTQARHQDFAGLLRLERHRTR